MVDEVGLHIKEASEQLGSLGSQASLPLLLCMEGDRGLSKNEVKLLWF